MKKILFILSFAAVIQQAAYAQGSTSDQLNAIYVAMPFLTIAADSRGGAMGETGVATSPDVNSMHWNPAKFIFAPNNMGFSVSFTPWLRDLIDDINLANLSYYVKVDQNQALAFSLSYFSLGSIYFTNLQGDPDGQFSPNEFSVDAAYSRKFSENLSGGLAFRYMRSDLTGGSFVGGIKSRAAWAFAADVAVYYFKNIVIADFPSKLSLGANIANIGNKVTYSESDNAQFIPITLKLGSALTFDLDAYNSITLATDFNKLLVPTPPIYEEIDGEFVITSGRNDNVPVAQGMLQSFYDAPGGFREEIREITMGIGAEYWYHKQFALRAGYFYEHETKGNRKFFTAGMGIKFNVFAIDFSYLIPVFRNNPLANTLRFTLAFDFEPAGRTRIQNPQI